MNITTYSVALSSEVHAEASRHLLRSDGQEDLCFGLWYPSSGSSRTSALIERLFLPGVNERKVHGNASFMPGYFERTLGEALEAGAGLAFFHSHGGPGWQDMSTDDMNAELGHAAATRGATRLPLVGLTLGSDGAWSARFWEKTGPRTYKHRWCANVRVVGEQLQVTYADSELPKPKLKKELTRTISAWGEDRQTNLARLHVGVVGVGSVGTIVAEALARTGISRVTLIDFDTIDFINLDRSLHATRKDAVLGNSKVATLAAQLRRSATAERFIVQAIERSIAEEEGFRAALDCDVLFSCVDRPWARQVLNFIAYAHLIPVVDGGIKVEVFEQGHLRRADWKSHVAAPGRRCLECLGQFDASLVQAEREGVLDDPRYIAGLPKLHPIRRNENVFAFSLSLASFEVLQMLMMIIAPLGFSNGGEQAYHFVPGHFDEPGFHACKEGCPYPTLTAKGDRTGFVVTGLHKRAEDCRAARQRAAHTRAWRCRFGQFLSKVADRLFEN